MFTFKKTKFYWVIYIELTFFLFCPLSFIFICFCSLKYYPQAGGLTNTKTIFWFHYLLTLADSFDLQSNFGLLKMFNPSRKTENFSFFFQWLIAMPVWKGEIHPLGRLLMKQETRKLSNVNISHLTIPPLFLTTLSSLKEHITLLCQCVFAY